MSTKSWKITNATSTKKLNLVLIDAYTDQVLPAVFFYEQTLNLITASSAQPYIAAGGYETFAMPDAHKDKAGAALDFTFIIAVAETLAPVVTKTYKSDLSDLSDLEVTDDMAGNIDTVIDFCKNITAFPTSDLAVDFAAALNSTTATAIDNFFANTLGYKTVKIDDVHLVQTYYKALPYGWADGKDCEFFLYSADYKNNTDTDEPIGTFSIKNDWTRPVAVTPDSGKFIISLTTSDDKATKTLEFKNGVFWDSITTDTPKVILAGSFIMPSELTKANSRNTIEAYLQGKLNGYDVFGLSSKAPHDQDDEDGFLDLFDVQNFKQGLDLAMYFVTIGMGIAFLVSCYYGAKFLKNKFNSDDDIDRQKKFDEMKEYIRQNIDGLGQRINPNIRIPQPANIRQNQNETREQLLDAKTRLAKANILEMANKQRAGFEAISSKFVTHESLNALDNIDTILTRIDNNSLAEFRESLGSTMEMLGSNNTTLIAGKTTVANRLAPELVEAYDLSRAAYDVAARQQEEVERELRDVEARNDERQVIEDEFVEV